MRSLLNRSAMVALCLILVAPAVAQAQSAGDEQYSDPFDTPARTVEKPDEPKTEPAPRVPVPAPAQGSAAPVPQLDASRGRTELARTGQDLRPFLGAGLALLAGGLMLLWRSSSARR